MKKSLLVVTLLVIASAFASAQTFGFGTSGGSYLYCNYETGLTNYSGAIWSAGDNLSPCGLGVNATMVGVATKVAFKRKPCK